MRACLQHIDKNVVHHHTATQQSPPTNKQEQFQPPIEEVLKKLRQGKKIPTPKSPSEKVEASRLTREKLKRKMQYIKLHSMAESSRPKKELTPEDIRHPETVPG